MIPTTDNQQQLFSTKPKVKQKSSQSVQPCDPKSPLHPKNFHFNYNRASHQTKSESSHCISDCESLSSGPSPSEKDFSTASPTTFPIDYIPSVYALPISCSGNQSEIGGEDRSVIPPPKPTINENSESYHAKCESSNVFSDCESISSGSCKSREDCSVATFSPAKALDFIPSVYALPISFSMANQTNIDCDIPPVISPPGLSAPIASQNNEISGECDLYLMPGKAAMQLTVRSLNINGSKTEKSYKTTSEVIFREDDIPQNPELVIDPKLFGNKTESSNCGFVLPCPKDCDSESVNFPDKTMFQNVDADIPTPRAYDGPPTCRNQTNSDTAILQTKHFNMKPIPPADQSCLDSNTQSSEICPNNAFPFTKIEKCSSILPSSREFQDVPETNQTNLATEELSLKDLNSSYSVSPSVQTQINTDNCIAFRIGHINNFPFAKPFDCSTQNSSDLNSGDAFSSHVKNKTFTGNIAENISSLFLTSDCDRNSSKYFEPRFPSFSTTMKNKNHLPYACDIAISNGSLENYSETTNLSIFKSKKQKKIVVKNTSIETCDLFSGEYLNSLIELGAMSISKSGHELNSCENIGHCSDNSPLFEPDETNCNSTVFANTSNEDALGDTPNTDYQEQNTKYSDVDRHNNAYSVECIKNIDSYDQNSNLYVFKPNSNKLAINRNVFELDAFYQSSKCLVKLTNESFSSESKNNCLYETNHPDGIDLPTTVENQFDSLSTELKTDLHAWVDPARDNTKEQASIDHQASDTSYCSKKLNRSESFPHNHSNAFQWNATLEDKRTSGNSALNKLFSKMPSKSIDSGLGSLSQENLTLSTSDIPSICLESEKLHDSPVKELVSDKFSAFLQKCAFDEDDLSEMERIDNVVDQFFGLDPY